MIVKSIFLLKNKIKISLFILNENSKKSAEMVEKNTLIWNDS
jgi:hypothetical protein